MIGNCKLNGAHIWCMICRDTRENDCYHANSILCSRSLTLSPHPQFTLAKHIFEAQISHPRSSFFHTKQRIRTTKKWYEFKSLAIYKRNRYSCEINILAMSSVFGSAWDSVENFRYLLFGSNTKKRSCNALRSSHICSLCCSRFASSRLCVAAFSAF